MAKIGSLLIRLGLDSGEFKSGLEVSERQLKQAIKGFERTGRKLKNFGRQMSLAVSLPMAAIGQQAVRGFIEQERAMADVKAALQSMGAVSGKTAGELEKVADKLEMNSLFDAEVILKEVTANLLTFGNVAGEQFDRAQQAALDMATRLGTGPKEAAIQLGKALNDPIRGLSALSRVGIQFSDSQRKMIEGMVRAGDVAGAQRVILGELEKQFGGAASAAADATPWRKAEVAIGQAMDKIGAAILPIIPPIAEAIADLANAFASLPEPVQKFIVIGGAVAAAIGPIAFGIGGLVSAFAPFLGELKLAGPLLTRVRVAMLALLANPVVLGAAAVIGGIYLAWKNWDKIKPVLQAIARAVSDFWNGTVAPVFSWLKETLIGGARLWWDLHVKAIEAVMKLAQGVRQWLVDKLASVWKLVTDKIEWVKNAFFNLYDAVVGNSYVPDMVDGIAREFARLNAAMVEPAQRATAKTGEAFRQLAGDVRDLLESAFPALAELRRQAEIRDTLARGVAAGLIAPETAREARFRLRPGAGEKAPLSPFLSEDRPLIDSEAFARAAEKIRKEITGLGKTSETVNARIVKSFKDMADQTISALDKLANSIKSGGFLDILGSVVGLALQLGSIGVFGKKIAANINRSSVPQYAAGTAFHPGGLAVVGERGPELVNLPRGASVIPNHRIASPQRVEIVPSPYFDVVVDGRVMRAAPHIAEASARVSQARAVRRQMRRIG